MKLILQNKTFYDFYFRAFNEPWMDGLKRHSTVFKFCFLMPMDLTKRTNRPAVLSHSSTLTVPHSELQPNSQIYQKAKAHSITKINFPTQNLTTAFYQHFCRGTTCQKSQTKARQCKFPNFPYELHWSEACLWTDCFLVLDLFLEFSFFLFIPLSSLTKWQGLPCHLS